MSEQPEAVPLGYGVSGWKSRQENARRKNSRGKSPEEREAIRAARRRLYDQQAEQAEKEAPAVDDQRQETQGETVTGDGFGEPLEPVNQEEPQVDDGQGQHEEVEMTREQMIQTLKDAGQKVGGNIGDATLAKRVEALYAENEAQA